jgi:hypothetical protein
MILIHTKKNLPCTSCKGKGKREALQIISIKITPLVECEGRVIIIKVKKSPCLHKTQVRGKILLKILLQKKNPPPAKCRRGQPVGVSSWCLPSCIPRCGGCSLWCIVVDPWSVVLGASVLFLLSLVAVPVPCHSRPLRHCPRHGIHGPSSMSQPSHHPRPCSSGRVWW